jgi:hypothetical protein
MIIVCNGYVDKRPIVYSLIKLLDAFGEVAVISQNKQLQRLLEDRSSSGFYNNTFIVVGEYTPDEVFSETEYKKEDFDHIIFDTYDTVPGDYDVFMHCRSFGMSDAEREIIEYISGVIQYNFVYDGRKEMGCWNIPVTVPLIKSVEEFEAKKLMVPIQSKDLTRSISRLLAPKLDITEKKAVNILKKGWRKK